MIYEIGNEHLKVQVSTLGGELMSVKKDGVEYLWQGNPEYWSGRAYNLFPICGRLWEGKYTYRGDEYEMNLHGFVRKSELELYAQTEDTIAFRLRPNEQTMKLYPFDFTYRVFYVLEGNTLKIRYRVRNKGFKPLIFAVGGHPGFNVPLEEGRKFEDYSIEFQCEKPAKSVVMSPACFVTEKREPFALENGKVLNLRHDLFDNDAIVLEDMCRSVKLCSDKGKRSVTVSYPDMRYLGIWHKPKSDAPYVCIEPWTSLPSVDGEVDDLETKADMETLESMEIYRNEWSITLE